MRAGALGVLGAIQRAAGPGLISAQSFERARLLAARLPPLGAGVSLECHLGPHRDRSDLIVRVFRNDCRALLADDAPELAAARRFAVAWTSSPGLRHIPYVDLEFDLDRDGEGRGCLVGAMIEPRLHAGLSAILEGRTRPSPDAPPASSFAVAADVLRACAPAPLDRRLLRRVAQCYAALPDEGFIGHLGLAPRGTRGPDDLVRLIVSLPRRAVADYMAAVDWPGDPAVLERVARQQTGAGGRLNFDLNVQRSRLAEPTAFYVTFWEPASAASSLRALLDDLRTEELVTASQRAAVLRFSRARPGRSRLTHTSTVKFTLSEGSVTAKAYLSWLRNVEANG